MSSCRCLPTHVGSLSGPRAHSAHRPRCPEMVRILSIDGGGILGVVALGILGHLERTYQRPISALFDLIAGVSTGGLIALGLAAPAPDKKRPRYSADDLSQLYRARCHEIFARSCWGKWSQLTPLTQGLHSLFCPSYDSRHARKVYQDVLGATRLDQALCHLLIPAYRLCSFAHSGTKTRAAPGLHLFSNMHSQAPWDRTTSWMYDVALSTCAAPTYFAPHRPMIIDAQGRSHRGPDLLIDGGVAINNPVVLAYSQAIALYPCADIAILSLSLSPGSEPYSGLFDGEQATVLSGMWRWLSALRPLLIHPQLSVYDHILQHMTQMHGGRTTYMRIEPPSGALTGALDDVSSDHLRHLDHVSQEIIQRWATDLRAFMVRIMPDARPPITGPR